MAIFYGLFSELLLITVTLNIWGCFFSYDSYTYVYMYMYIPSGKHTKNYGKIHHFEWENPLFLWVIFNSYVKLPEGMFFLGITFEFS